jgi:hypothetical protein
MIFWASAEVFQPAYDMLRRCRVSIEERLNKDLAKSSLLNLNVQIRYVPIVMPSDMIARYPARTNVQKSKRLLDCAPQLDYDAFIDTDFPRALHEYIQGIIRESHHLSELGLSTSQIIEFVRIVGDAENEIMSEHQ